MNLAKIEDQIEKVGAEEAEMAEDEEGEEVEGEVEAVSPSQVDKCSLREMP